MRSFFGKKGKTIGAGTLLGVLSLSISGVSPIVSIASENVDQCQPVSVVSVSVTHSWPRSCEHIYDCWRRITMFTDGRLEFADNDGQITAAMDSESRSTLGSIVDNSTLLSKLDKPLSPECLGWDSVNDTEIRVDLSNGASLSTKWAAGCRNIDGHPFKQVNDLAIEQRIAHIDCDPFDSALFEEGFDLYDYWAMNDVLLQLDGQSVHGLCFPCGGRC